MKYRLKIVPSASKDIRKKIIKIALLHGLQLIGCIFSYGGK